MYKRQFQSYDASKPMDPYGTLIKDGKLVHKGDLSAVIGLGQDNTVKIGIMQPVVSLNLGTATIKADYFNHTPAQDGSAVAIFTDVYKRQAIDSGWINAPDCKRNMMV